MEVWQTVIATVGSVIVAMITVGLPMLHQNKKTRKSEIDEVLDAVKKIRDDMAANNQLTVSNARAQLEAIYRKYESSQSMPESSWKAVCELHESYKMITLPNGKHPNSWADALYNEMGKWKKC